MTQRRNLFLAALAALAAAAQTARADADLDELMQKTIKDALKTVGPCVVQIETQGGTDVISRGGPGGGMVRKGFGPTTGVIVSADGYIISSAFNFANKPATIDVAIPGHKDRLSAKVVATDQTRMLTLLKVDAKDLPLPTPLPKAEFKSGQTTLALGRTLPETVEQPPSVDVGILSAVGRIWGKAVQTDAKISPVNYGGPLCDLTGRVIGVIVPASPNAEGQTAGFELYDSGLGFAIPLEDVNAILPRLKEGTDLKRGVLGVNVQTQDPYTTPPVIASVEPGSAADKAGLKPGDRIKEIDGKPVESQVQLQTRLGTKYEGDVISLKVQRDKEEINLPAVTLSGVVAAFGQAFLGIVPVRDDPGPGVEVRYVFPKSPADEAGIKAGDRIVKAGPGGPPPAPPLPPPPLNPVANRDQLMDLLTQAKPGLEVKLEVARKDGGKHDTLNVKLGEQPADVPDKLPDNDTAKKAKHDDKKPETGLLQKTSTDGTHGYWLYVPDKYDPSATYALVVWLHPPGKAKDGDVKAFRDAWEDYCAANHLIVAMPIAENENGWKRTESEFVAETVKAATDTYNIDKRRIVLHGMGVGGEMALYLAFHNRQLYRGVATTGSALTGAPKERVANLPVSFYLVAGGKDPLKDLIKDTAKKLSDFKYAATYKEIKDMGQQYLDEPTLKELVRWIDSLDRI
jgi:S1-C subfamily serine protease/poly(3-hydroxybutyrate) depolymerase